MKVSKVYVVFSNSSLHHGWWQWLNGNHETGKKGDTSEYIKEWDKGSVSLQYKNFGFWNVGPFEHKPKDYCCESLTHDVI